MMRLRYANSVGKPKILLVDDDDVLRAVAKEALVSGATTLSVDRREKRVS